MDLKIKLTADATAAERGVAAFAQRSQKYMGSIGSELSSRIAGAFAAPAVLGAISSFARSVVHAVDEVKDLSDQLGISTDEVQRLQKAANDSGVKFGVIATALQKIDALRSQAMSGDKNAKSVFDSLGLDPSQGTSLELLQRAVDASANGTREQAALFDLIGRKAGVLRNIIAEFRAQGPIELISQDQIQAIDAANQRLEESKRRLTAAASGPLAGLLRAYGANIEAMTDTKRPGRMLTSLFGPVIAFRSIRAALFGGPPRAASDNAGVGGGGGAIPPISAIPAMSSPALGRSGDALSRIGLFVGGAPGVQSLRSIERNTADASASLREANRLLRMIFTEQQNGGS